MPVFTSPLHTTSFVISHNNASPHHTKKHRFSSHLTRVPELVNTIVTRPQKLLLTNASTREFDCEYCTREFVYSRVQVRVLVSSLVSTRECTREYSRVNTRESRLTCGQGITRVYSHTLAFSTRVRFCMYCESLTLVC